jgi:Glycosyl transferase family 2/Glycosyltransferase family 87
VSVTLAPRWRGIEAARSWRAATAAALGAGLFAVEILIRSEAGLRGQIAGQLVAFALYLPAAWLCWRGLGIGRRGVVLVLGVAVLLRAVAFDPASPPRLTTDPYRYAWDARVQADGLNPYRYPPDAPELRHLRDTEIWPSISRKDWLTVYPPGAEASFLAARTAFGTSVRATTWLFLLAEGAALVLLLLVLTQMRAPHERVAIAAWHPLAVSEIAGNGHVDALALFAGALLLAGWVGRRRWLSGVAVGFGALVKLGPLLLVPALARSGGRRFVVAALATVAGGYALYATAGRDVVGSLFRYLDREDLGSLAWWALAPHLGREVAAVLLFVAVLAIVTVVSLRAHDSVDQVARSALLVLGSLLLAAAFLQPWYALWLLPFLVVTAAPAWLWLTGTLPLLYTFGLDEGALPWWVRVVIYVPFAVLSLAWIVRPRRQQPAAVPPLEGPIRVAAVIPALDEAEALPRLLGEFPAQAVDEIVVVDGGSRDGTPEAARAAGARVVVEPRRGYGRACLAGVNATDAEILVFLDGDGSDDPAAIPQLVAPILSGRAALVLGARTEPESGAQHAHQRLGNRLVALLVRVCYQVEVRDIPPMRAVRRDVLLGLDMMELTYGWPTEMVVKAARGGLPLVEVAVPSRARRGGRSKVSGRLGPSLKAGGRMLAVVGRYA